MTDELDHVFGDDPDLVDEDSPISDSELDPSESFPGGTAELVALAAEDANLLLRFVESAMTEAEAAAFLLEVRTRDPESAERLLQMREDQRLLRTSLDIEPPPPDLLGPVRAQIARGELVQVQADLPVEDADPTAFMARSVESLARHRRRARRRPLTLAAIFGSIGVLIGVLVAPRLSDRSGSEVTSSPVGEEPLEIMTLATFGLVIPIGDRPRIELSMAIVAANHGAVLVRCSRAGDSATGAEIDPPLVGPPSGAPDATLRRDLGLRGFDHAIVVPRDEVSFVLAEVGALANPGPDGRSSARLVPSDATNPQEALSKDAWESWSRQSEAARGLPAEARRLVVPIALVESDEGV